VVAWCWWVSEACLLLAFIATVFGISWTARPFRIIDNQDGTATSIEAGPKGSVLLGVGLLFTTLAGAFALLAALPWMAA
jgi:hypothetical protein